MDNQGIALNYWWNRAKRAEAALEKYADADSDYYISHTKEVSGVTVYVIKDIQQLSKLAKEVLDKRSNK
jgi:hypothetical protein